MLSLLTPPITLHHTTSKHNNTHLPSSPPLKRSAFPLCPTEHFFDPLELLGSDIFQAHILPLLDAPSLARSTAVNRHWLELAVSDALWKPLCRDLWATPAHLPLEVLCSLAPRSPYRDFSITMQDAGKVRLTPEEMCARVWEIRVKPTCGPYWCALDPTFQGGVPLLRRFHCDYSISALRPDDPIWGGQESLWEFAYSKHANEEIWNQHVQVNRWPHLSVAHLSDGRWHLDNAYGSYTTCPDQKSNMASFLRGLTRELCANNCHYGFGGMKEQGGKNLGTEIRLCDK